MLENIQAMTKQNMHLYYSNKASQHCSYCE